MKLAHLAVVFACAMSPLAARAQGPAPALPANEATLVVTGDAVVERSPDIAHLSVEIITSDDDATRSAGKNTTIFNALKAKLATFGISKDALRTTYFNVTNVPYPPKGLPPEQRQPRYGYVTSRNVTISIAPIENVGKVVDAATAAGVTQVGDASFELKDRKAAYREALGNAMSDAKRNAAALTGPGEFRIVRIRNVSTGGYFSPQPRPLAAVEMRAAVAAPAPPTEIDPNGPITVSAHVTVTYEIK